MTAKMPVAISRCQQGYPDLPLGHKSFFAKVYRQTVTEEIA